MNRANNRTFLEKLLKLPKFGSGIGLHRMQWFQQHVWKGTAPKLETIKVTGSNGKGSVCAMLSSIFSELSISHGLYTSPHLLRFNERIKIGTTPISDGELSTAIEWFETHRSQYASRHPNDTVGAFEAFTAIALYYYASQNTPLLIAEAGIGGRYDSTRVLPGKLAALTSLDLEHTHLLGDTLELIAYEKMDLCESDGTLVLGKIDPTLLPRLRAYARLRKIDLVPVQEEFQAANIRYGATTMQVDLEWTGSKIEGLKTFNDLTLNLMGPHQVQNACVAIALAHEWIQSHCPHLSPSQFRDAVYQGLRKVQWPGRFEQVHQAPDIFIDVGHSPQAVESLVLTVQQSLQNRKILLVTGVSANKRVEDIVKCLLTIADEVICTRAYHKGAPVEQIASIVKQAPTVLPHYIAPTIEQALHLALDISTKQSMTVLVAGGLFLSMEAKLTLSGLDPQGIRFF